MSPRYLYQPHNAHQHPYAHLLQELQVEEVEAEEVEAVEEAVEEAEEEEAEAEQEEADKQTPLTSDSAEALLKYSREKGKRQTASSPNSNATI